MRPLGTGGWRKLEGGSRGGGTQSTHPLLPRLRPRLAPRLRPPLSPAGRICPEATSKGPRKPKHTPRGSDAASNPALGVGEAPQLLGGVSSCTTPVKIWELIFKCAPTPSIALLRRRRESGKGVELVDGAQQRNLFRQLHPKPHLNLKGGVRFAAVVRQRRNWDTVQLRAVWAPAVCPLGLSGWRSTLRSGEGASTASFLPGLHALACRNAAGFLEVTVQN